MTIDEYFAIPPDRRHTLLLYGNMKVLPSPGVQHNDATHNLGIVLRRWTHHYELGRLCFSIDMVLDKKESLVHAPDLVFVSTSHQRRLKHGRLYGAADLCVDIHEASESSFVSGRKFSDYQRFGIPWYWSLYLSHDPPMMEECQLINGRYECRSEISGDEWFEPGLFPGLVFRLPPLLEGDLKAAVKGKAKKLM